MNGNWQLILALVFVAGAVFVLVRRAWRLWRNTTGTGCAACPGAGDGSANARQKPFVSVEMLEDEAVARQTKP